MSRLVVRTGTVPESAIIDLLAAVTASVDAAILPDPASLIDLRRACQDARRFKLDVSFRLDGRDHARFSLNDKGEPRAFRERLLSAADDLGLPQDVEDLLEIVRPGEVQTTMGVKWGASGGSPERVSIYFEELFRSPRHEAIRQEVVRLGLGVEAPPPPEGLEPVSVCLDYADGFVVAAKDYFMETLRAGDHGLAVSPVLAAFRERLDEHPINGTRRFLHARRLEAGGMVSGHKLLWMSEAHRPADADRAWAFVDSLLASPGPWEPSTTASALMSLRQSWRHAPAAYLYPDLVSLDVAARGQPVALVVYVSVK